MFPPPYLANVELPPVPLLGDLLEHRGRHVLVGQLLEDLLRALRHVPRPSEDERQRPDRLRHQPEGDLVAGVADALSVGTIECIQFIDEKQKTGIAGPGNRSSGGVTSLSKANCSQR